MTRDYSTLSYEELRELLLNSELDNESMNQEEYGFLLDSEATLDEPNADVLEFCVAGLKKYDKYKDCEDLIIYGAAITKQLEWEALFKELNSENDSADYREFACIQLRKLVLNSQLENENIDRAILEALLDYESKLDKPNSTVIKFCKSRLNKKSSKAKISFRIHKRVAVALIAIFTALVIATVTAAAMGYNVIDLFFGAWRANESTNTDNDGNQIIIMGDSRVYNSMSEILGNENLRIFYPTELPLGYSFTNFEIDNSGSQLIVEVTATEPFISFVVMVGANIEIDDYSYEINGMKYNIFEMGDGLYQADFSIGEDYYMIVVDNKTLLSEIIENLKES
jgi:hypothetical protein